MGARNTQRAASREGRRGSRRRDKHDGGKPRTTLSVVESQRWSSSVREAPRPRTRQDPGAATPRHRQCVGPRVRHRPGDLRMASITSRLLPHTTRCRRDLPCVRTRTVCPSTVASSAPAQGPVAVNSSPAPSSPPYRPPFRLDRASACWSTDTSVIHSSLAKRWNTAPRQRGW